MTEELIREHIQELNKQLEQWKANIHATQGAIQDCEYWLSVLKEDKDV